MNIASFKTVASAALIAAAFGAGLSVTEAQAGSKSFERADLNGDGFVTREELDIQGIRASRFFNRADHENDGRLDPVEFQRMRVLRTLASGRDN